MQGDGGAGGKSEQVDLEALETHAKEGVHEARLAIEAFAKQNPRTAVAVALGVGFVVGGGLTPRLLFGLGAIAARKYAADYAKNQLGAMARGALGVRDDEEEADPARPPSREGASHS